MTSSNFIVHSFAVGCLSLPIYCKSNRTTCFTISETMSCYFVDDMEDYVDYRYTVPVLTSSWRHKMSILSPTEPSLSSLLQ
jgi:hypothetical protein